MVDPVPTAEMLLLYANNLKKDLSRISSFNFKNSNIDNNDIFEKSSIITDLSQRFLCSILYSSKFLSISVTNFIGGILF
jgi:hypothetical protein